MTTLPTIGFSVDYRRSDGPSSGFFRQILPTIRRSYFGFFSYIYRRSDDQILDFLATFTDDPTIKFWIFWLLLPTIRRPKLWCFGYFYQWSVTFRLFRFPTQLLFFCKISHSNNLLFMIINRNKLSHAHWAVNLLSFLLLSYIYPLPPTSS